MSYLRYFILEFKYTLVLKKRYLLNFIAGVINLALFFFFLSKGISSFNSNVPQDVVSDKIQSVMLYFFVYLIVFNGIAVIVDEIADGAKTGLLEQTILCPMGSHVVYIAKSFSASLFNLLISLIMLPVYMYISHCWFHIPGWTILSIVLPLWFCSWGVGFIIGSFTIIYKKTNSFFSLVEFLVLSLIIMPFYPFTKFSFLPITPQVAMLNKILVSSNNAHLSWYIFIYLHSVIWLFLGITIFKFSERLAKTKGLLGQY